MHHASSTEYEPPFWLYSTLPLEFNRYAADAVLPKLMAYRNCETSVIVTADPAPPVPSRVRIAPLIRTAQRR
jgi:hypothetical protein